MHNTVSHSTKVIQSIVLLLYEVKLENKRGKKKKKKKKEQEQEKEKANP